MNNDLLMIALECLFKEHNHISGQARSQSHQQVLKYLLNEERIKVA